MIINSAGAQITVKEADNEFFGMLVTQDHQNDKALLACGTLLQDEGNNDEHGLTSWVKVKIKLWVRKIT